MPGTPKIYGPRTNQVVRRAVKNFNAKIARELKKEPQAIAWMPDRVSVKQIKENYRTRADVNFAIKSLRAFSTPGQINLVELKPGEYRTVWEVNQLKMEAKRTNASRAKRLAAINPNTRDGTMGYTEILNLNPMKTDLKKMTVEDFKCKRSTARREAARDYDTLASNLYKTNYYAGLDRFLPNYAERIKALTAGLTGAQMAKAYATDPVLHIDFIYDPKQEAIRAEHIIEHWQDFLGQIPEVSDAGDEWDGDLDED